MPDNSEIFERLSRIEQIVARIDERTKAHDSAHGDHEQRIRALTADEIAANYAVDAARFGLPDELTKGEIANGQCASRHAKYKSRCKSG